MTDRGSFVLGGFVRSWFYWFVGPVERVAREGYEGVMAGRRIVIPGKVNRAYGMVSRLLPRGLLLRFDGSF